MAKKHSLESFFWFTIKSPAVKESRSITALEPLVMADVPQERLSTCFRRSHLAYGLPTVVIVYFDLFDEYDADSRIIQVLVRSSRFHPMTSHNSFILALTVSDRHA